MPARYLYFIFYTLLAVNWKKKKCFKILHNLFNNVIEFAMAASDTRLYKMADCIIRSMSDGFI